VTVPATARRAGPFLGTGAITALPFTFKVFEPADLVVTKTTATGIETLLELTTDYTVTLNPDQDSTPGGTITPAVAPTTSESLTLTSGLQYEQTLDLLGGGKFSPKSIEDAFDRTVIQIQQLAEENARTIKLPVSLPGDATLPAPVPGQVIAWGDDGQSLVNLSPEDIASVVVAGTSYYDQFSGNGSTAQFSLTANPGGVNALDVVVGAVPQKNGTDFTVSGTTLTFAVAPPAGTNNVGVRYTAALPIGTANAQDVTFLQAGTGAVARSAQVKLRDVVSVKDFGAVGDGVANDAPAFANAVASGAGSVYVPPGTYRITSQIPVTAPNVRVYGAGRRSTKIVQATNTTPVFSVTGSYFTLESLSIEYATQGASGATAVLISGAFYSNIWDLYIYRANIGMYYTAAANSHQAASFVIEDATTAGVFVDSAVNLMASTFQILNSNTTLCSLGCIRIFGASEGNNFFNGHTFRGSYALISDANAYTFGARPSYNKFHAVYFDASANGALIDKSTEFDFTDCWFSTRPGNGAYVVQTDGIRFTGGGAINCDSRGVLVEATAKRVVFKNFAVRGNSVSAANTFDGIVFAPNTTDFIVQGCTFTNSVVTFGTQRYGVAVNTGTSDRYVIADNLVSGNGTGGVFDGGSGVNKRVANNY
jgi:hypothetical protein